MSGICDIQEFQEFFFSGCSYGMGGVYFFGFVIVLGI